jgi:hypothetical protein
MLIRCFVWEKFGLTDEALQRALEPFSTVVVVRSGESSSDRIDRSNLKVFADWTPRLERQVKDAMSKLGCRFEQKVLGPTRLIFKLLELDEESERVDRRSAVVRVTTSSGDERLLTRLWICDRSNVSEIEQLVREAAARHQAYYGIEVVCDWSVETQ